MTIITLRSVTSPPLASTWGRAWQLLEPALNRLGKRYKRDLVRRDVADLRKQLWLAESGDKVVMAALTEVVVYDDRKSLNILAIGGEGYGLWQQWFADLETLARRMGCQMIEGLGRAGWSRVMADHGLRPVAVLYAKEL